MIWTLPDYMKLHSTCHWLSVWPTSVEPMLSKFRGEDLNSNVLRALTAYRQFSHLLAPFFFFLIHLFTFLASLGLRCCKRTLSSCSQRETTRFSSGSARASLVAEHRLEGALAQ